MAPLTPAIELQRRPVARAVASGFGIGRVPVLAGTVASAAAVLAGAGLTRISPWALPLAALSAIAGGLWSVRAADACDDPGWVVIDEFAGQWITLLALRGGPGASPGPMALFSGFVLFRLIDIAKPWPVSLADRSKTAAGVIGDDVIAGGLAAGLLWALQDLWPRAFS